ncbi:MAG: SRPBCC family protein [Anaerolineae bacterium]|nr:SRPBCC family protein [Anaerolineae bacterium]
MTVYHLSASALIQAPPQKLYAIIADYQNGHPHILPKPPFVALAVEKGGIGSGTVFRAYMRVLGQLQSFRALVTEPEPGRVLVEITDNGYITTFTVDPRADGQQAYVTIATKITGRTGLLGMLEGRLITRMMRPVYDQELEKLAAFAAL